MIPTKISKSTYPTTFYDIGADKSPSLNQFPSVPEFTFFVYDHLGNTRVMYHNDMYDCQAFHTHYVLEHVLDYYPYGKTLREYLLDRERFETTYHERDIESGLDYRGARFYDGDVGRFLSCDPKAADFAGWSTYNYVLGNPIRFVDADRMSPVDPIDPNKHERWPFYRSFGNSAYNAVLNRGGTNGYKGMYIIAQQRVENGFDMTPPGNNPFNIKGSGDAGTFKTTTTEFVKGKKIVKKQSFAKFSSVEAGLEGYTRFKVVLEKKGFRN